MRLRWVTFLIVLCSVCLSSGPVVASAQNAAVSVGVGDTILSVSGTTSPGAFVTISRDGGVIGTTVANNSGAFSQTFPAQSPGLHQVSVFAHTTGGVSTDTVTVTVNITEHGTTSVQIFLPSTLSIANTSLTYGQPLQLSGETAPSSTVAIYIDNTNYASTVSNAQGVWTIDVSTLSLAAGQHSLFVKVTDSLGAQSYPSRAYSFITSAKPRAPGTLTPAVPVIIFPTPGLVWQQPTLTVRGSADKGVQIELWDGEENLGSVWSDDQGQWSIVITLATGDHAIKARACLRKVCSAFSSPVFFSFRPSDSGLPPLKIKVPQSSFLVDVGKPVTIRATVLNGQPPYTITLQWGDRITEQITSGKHELLFTHRYNKPGAYSVTLDVQDATKRQSQVYFSIDVEPPPSWLLRIVLIIALLALGLLYLYWRRHKAHTASV